MQGRCKHNGRVMKGTVKWLGLGRVGQTNGKRSTLSASGCKKKSDMWQEDKI